MKTVKRLFMLMLALIMVFSMSVTVMAEETKYTISIYGSTSASAESAKGHTYEAYQILTGTVDPDIAANPGDAVVKLADVDWGAHIKSDELLEALKADATFGEGAANLFSSVTTADGFVEVIGSSSFHDTLKNRLAHVLSKNIDKTTPTDVTTEPGPPYTLEVPAGYYLIMDKDRSLEGMTDKDYTDIILEVSRNVNIHHKGSVPTVTKTVSEQNNAYDKIIDAALETVYYYKLVGTLPSDFDKYDQYSYQFVDTLSAGIDYVGIEKIYAVYNNGNELALTPSNKDTGYYDETNRKLTITFDNLKHDNNMHNFAPGNQIIVIYKAKLNPAAVVAGEGNNNTVHLVYSNDPQGTGTGITKDDNTTVYTFAIKVVKYDGADPTKFLKDVTFILYRNIQGTPEYAKVDENGKITAWTADESQATVLKTSSEGEFVVHGLDSGKKYYLKELSTNEGYNTIEDPIEFQLTPVKEGEAITGLQVTPSSYYNSLPNSYTEDGNMLGVTMKIPNNQGVQLPSTGGMGTTVLYAAGAILVVGAVVLLITKKRMK